MNGDQNPTRSEEDAELEREIRHERKFTIEEAIGRLAGPGAMKGESPVSRLQQAQYEVTTWLRNRLGGGGGLEVVLSRDVSSAELLLKNLDQPLAGLSAYLQRVLASDHLLCELVRDADCEWGRIVQERPYFNKTGSPAHPEDPYTIESVRITLSQLLSELATAGHG